MWRSHPRCVSNLHRPLQGKTIYGICMTFLKTRSGYFVGTPPRVRNIRDTRCAGPAQVYQSMRFQTYAHQLLTERGLAYWFMDDGDSYTKTRSHLRYYRFNTQSFLLSDQKRLVQALKDNFDIDATIQKNHSYYILYIWFFCAPATPTLALARSRSLSLALARSRSLSRLDRSEALGLDQY